MPENELRLHRCCFTGHRPEKLRFSESEICSLLDEEIKNAIEEIFKGSVVNVNTVNVHGKMKRMGRHQGRTASWKKAIVTLREGDSIEVFEGL